VPWLKVGLPSCVFEILSKDKTSWQSSSQDSICPFLLRSFLGIGLYSMLVGMHLPASIPHVDECIVWALIEARCTSATMFGLSGVDRSGKVVNISPGAKTKLPALV